jgi:hypothetical protein
MANDIMTQASELVVLSPEIWSQRFQDVNRAMLPFLDSVSRDHEQEISDIGDIVNIFQVPDFSQANTLSEGASGQAEGISVTQAQLTINQRPYKDFIVSKKAQLQSIPFMDKLRDAAVYSINKKIQQIIIDAISPSAAAPDHQISFDSSTTLALADILEAKELLMEANCPQEGLIMVLGSEQFSDLYNISGYTSKDFIPQGSPLSSGEFAAPLSGFMPRFTTVAGDTSYFFHPSFMTAAIQQNLNIEVASMGGEGVRAQRVNVDALMGVLQLDNQRVVAVS